MLYLRKKGLERTTYMFSTEAAVFPPDISSAWWAEATDAAGEGSGAPGCLLPGGHSAPEKLRSYLKQQASFNPAVLNLC